MMRRMEFTPTGWFAVFSGTEARRARAREVDGWDAVTGAALVVDAERGARRPVDDYPDFSHLERADRVVAALPGDGWHACERGRRAQDPDSPAEPVVAWLVLSRGAVVPITMDAEGEIGPDKTMNRFFPPGTAPAEDTRPRAADPRPMARGRPARSSVAAERAASGRGIELSFTLPELDSGWRRTWDVSAQGDPAGFTESALCYDYFAAHVALTIGEVEFMSEQGAVPLVDLALSFRWVIDRLSRGENASIGFTEHAEVIRLRLDGESVAVSSSERPVRASVPRAELVAALSEFLRLAHTRLVAEVPALECNPVVQRFKP